MKFLQQVKIGCGLINIGNSCFFNASLQALFHTPIFLQKTSGKKCNLYLYFTRTCTRIHYYSHIGECVICCVQSLYEKTKSSKLPCDPSNLYGTLRKTNTNLARILNGGQQDAHEFFKFFIPVMENNKHPEMSFANKFIADIVTNIECLECNTNYQSENQAADFIVNIVRKHSVEEAFQSFFENDFVDEYKCITCMKSVLATKKFTLVSAPEYLCIILNRLKNRRTKLRSNIAINRELEVKCFAEGQASHWKYGLLSAVNHIGLDYNSGHYTTTVFSDKTYTFNDSKVRKQNNISGSDAYILIYERTEVIIIFNSSPKF